ncbi:MAG: HAD family hydrolase [Acholeplasmatales bacterium]|jgi:Cof subfamily protein (haloacid dehalogenase superfamily)|nr:HAD family hydrolase [Acholeplasmatales bacterium]
MKYKIIFCDLDGTLFSSIDSISRKSINSIKRYTDMGGIFVICTGREYESANSKLEYLRSEGIKIDYLIYNMGANIREADIPIFSSKYDLDTSLEILKIFDEVKCNFQCFDEKYAYIKKKNFQFEILSFFVKMKNYVKVEPSLYDKVADKKIEIVKFSGFDSYRKISKCIKLIEARLAKKVDIIGSGMFFDCLDSNTNKGNAVKFLCDRLNVDVLDCVAIGDSSGDVSMLDIVGYPYIMENADSDTKKPNYLKALSNTKDGVAIMIDQLIELELEEKINDIN